MASESAVQRRRSPALLLERNRERIVEAVVAVLGDHGWSGLTYASVARVAGLSPRPVQDRFPDRWALAVAAWEHTAGPALESFLEELIASVGLIVPGTPALLPEADQAASPASTGLPESTGLPASTGLPEPTGLHERLQDALERAGLLPRPLQGGSPAGSTEAPMDPQAEQDPVEEMHEALGVALDAARRADYRAVRAAGPSPEWLARALEPFLRPDATLRSAIEILVMSQFDLRLGAAVTDWAGHKVAGWCNPSTEDPARSARCAYLTSVALGLLLARTRAAVADLDLRGESWLLFEALQSDATPAQLPDVRADHLERFLEFDSEDPALDALLRATMEEVGRVGFDAATTAGIGRASGYSEGLLFARYPSKVELFVDATRRQHAQNWRLNEEFQQTVAAAHGAGVAEAVVIREFQRPHLRVERAINLEQVRLALHDDRLREVQWGELDAMVAAATSNDPDWLPAVSAAHLHMAVAIGLGSVCLTLLVPDAWQLPYDVVAVPLDELTSPMVGPGGVSS